MGTASDRRWRQRAALVPLVVLLLAGWLLACSSGDDPAGEGSAGPGPTGPTAADPPAEVVWAVGDGADGSREAKQVAGLIDESGVDRFLYLGDVYERGTPAEFESGYEPVYGRFDEIAEPTPGNHEWPLYAKGYGPYWKKVTGERQPDHYAFELGGWQLLSLNSEGPHDPESEQVAWLRRKVEAPGTCRLAFWHSPRYTAGTVHPERPDLEPFWSALVGKAAIVLTGHDHNMQRFEPIDGLTELIAGAGGHGHYPLAEDERLAFGNDTDYGALRLELQPGLASFRFVAADGRTLDSGTVPCEPLA